MNQLTSLLIEGTHLYRIYEFIHPFGPIQTFDINILSKNI